MNTVRIPFRKDAKLKEPWGETVEERETAGGGVREKQQSATTDWASQRFQTCFAIEWNASMLIPDSPVAEETCQRGGTAESGETAEHV